VDDARAEMDQADVAAWGLTDSFEIAYHLQSYFRAFRSSVFRSPPFHRFMHKPWHTMGYDEIVRNGEVALCREVLHPLPTVAMRSAVAHDKTNPHFSDWRGTLLQAHALKKKKLQAMSVQERGQLRRTLQSKCGLPAEQLRALLDEMQL
jgi:hypothetical protein